MRSSLCRSYSLGSAICCCSAVCPPQERWARIQVSGKHIPHSCYASVQLCRSLLSQEAATVVPGRKRDSSQQGQQLCVVLIVFDGYRRLPVVNCFLTNFKANFESCRCCSQQTVAAQHRTFVCYDFNASPKTASCSVRLPRL